MRCAIYTRKSSEEGLEQEFNSLHAQREACEAYIKSQKHEGWIALPAPYDDGGFSGGTMERPGLARLMDDIRAGKIDIVVVYKVDRLTRSLADFAKIVETFDNRSVSFVSVTQQFNTTTSMGRLTLNVLLSFAQFEREVTGERIRDKIAASKKKGLWMGGYPPMGYVVKDRRLVIEEADATIIRELFRLYTELKSTRAVYEEAERRKFRTAERVSKSGKRYGGCAFTRGHIDKILTNRIYLGDIVHGENVYPGEHEAIIDRTTWDQVQSIRKQNASARQSKTNIRAPSPLAGLLYDSSGEPMTATHAVKDGKRYRYYVSRSLVRRGDTASPLAIRVPAADIERLVITSIVHWLRDSITDTKRPFGRCSSGIKIAEDTSSFADRLEKMEANKQADFLSQVCTRIQIGRQRLTLKLSRERFEDPIGINATSTENDVTIEVPVRLHRVGGENRMLTPEDEDHQDSEPDPTIIRVLARAHDWAEQLTSGRMRSINQIARSEGVNSRYVARLLPLGFLPPNLMANLVAGQHSPYLTAEVLTRRSEMASVSWTAKLLTRGSIETK